MVEQTKDINRALSYIPYYTEGFDINFIKYITECLSEERDECIEYSFNFLIDSEIKVTFENLPHLNMKRTTIENDKITLSIEEYVNKIQYKRYDKKENTIYTLNISDCNEDITLITIETTIEELGKKTKKALKLI